MAVNPLSTATAGLQAMRDSIGIVSQNVANAGTAGYVKRTLSTVSTGPGNAGVAVGKLTRSFDAAALNQLRLETSGAGYTATKADILAQVDKLYGAPGDTTALDGVMNSFTQSLQTLAANPTSASARTAVVSAASTLASQIGSIAQGVQDLRTGVETRLGTETQEASGILATIAKLNLKIAATGDDGTRVSLLDQRDQALTQLSGYFDVKTQTEGDGTLTVRTNSGATLVERGIAATLSFDGRGALGADDAYAADPTKRGVGTIIATTPGGAKVDLGEPGILRSGTIAAEFELRDTILPQAQRQLDDLAGGLSRALTDKTVTGTTTTAGGTSTTAIDLTGLKAGNSITIPVTVNGAVRNVVLVAANGATQSADPSVTQDGTALAQTFDLTGAPGSLVANITAALTALGTRTGAAGPSVTVGGTGAAITLTGGTGTVVNGASASITQPSKADGDFGGSYPQIPLFVDGSPGSVFTGSPITGLAQRLRVNAAIVSNTTSLTAASAGGTTPDATRPNFIYDALTSAKQVFSSASGIGGIQAPHSASVVGFAQEVIAFQGEATTTATSIDQGQQVALSTAQGRFASSAGVNIDEEMSRLIELQTAYTANARVLTAARDMLDTLLRI